MPNENESPAESSPVILPDDRQRAVDDLGRRAGAALRSPAPRDGATGIMRRARNQRLIRVGGMAGAALVAVVVGIVVIGRPDDSARQRPSIKIADDTIVDNQVTSPALSPTKSTLPETTTVPLPAPSVANLFHVTAGTSVANRSIEQYVEKFAYSADGSVLAAVGVGFALRIYDTATLEMTRELACPTSVGKDGNGGLTWDQQVAGTWDPESKALKTAMGARQGFGGDCEIAFSSDGSHAARTASESTTILWNASEGTQIAVLDGVSPVFSPDGAIVITFTTNATKIWDASSGHPRATVAGDSDWAVFTPDGTRFVTLGTKAQLWDTRTLAPLTSFNSSNAAYVGAAFNSDGTRLATANSRIVSIWDTATGDELHQLQGGTGDLIYVGFSPDGTLLASGGTHHEGLRVFDTATGQELANLYQDNDASGFVAFSPDRKTLAVSVFPDEPTGTQRGLHLWSYSRN